MNVIAITDKRFGRHGWPDTNGSAVERSENEIPLTQTSASGNGDGEA